MTKFIAVKFVIEETDKTGQSTGTIEVVDITPAADVFGPRVFDTSCMSIPFPIAPQNRGSIEQAFKQRCCGATLVTAEPNMLAAFLDQLSMMNVPDAVMDLSSDIMASAYCGESPCDGLALSLRAQCKKAALGRRRNFWLTGVFVACFALIAAGILA